MQLALPVVKPRCADKREGIIRRDAFLGIDIAEVNLIGRIRKIRNYVAQAAAR